MIIIESTESLKMLFAFSSFFQQLVINMLLTAASFYAFTDLRATKIRQIKKKPKPRTSTIHIVKTRAGRHRYYLVDIQNFITRFEHSAE